MSLTKLYVGEVVDCPFSSAIEMLERSLTGRDALLVSPVDGVSERVKIGWSIVDDLGDAARAHEAIALFWKPDHAMFPSFSGTLTARPHGRRSSLRVTGSYEPPLGKTGAVIDRVAGRYVAYATLQRLLRELKADIESRYLVYLQEIGATRADRHAGGESDQVLRTH